MLSIQEFCAFVKETVFPESLKSLASVTKLEHIAEWRKELTKALNSKPVVGLEPLNPQEEESKDDLPVPQRIFVEI